MDQILNENDNQSCFNDYFTYLETIGQGAFGTVVKAINNITKQIVAVKIISKAVIKKQLEQEAIIFSSLNHPNIVKFFDIKRTDTRILLEMELIKGGSLQNLMQTLKLQTWLQGNQSQQIIKGILQALSYIHENQFVHLDLKPDNIMIVEKTLEVKITDFGLSSQHNRYALMRKKCGTLSYMAPELLQKKVYNKNVDIWSVGIIMYQLLNKGEHPYYRPGTDQEQLIINIQKMHTDLDYGNMSPLEVSLFRRMTEIDQSKRYSAYQALRHPWITESNDAEIPQNFFEIQDLWLLSQKMVGIMKFLMLIQCLKDNPRIVKKKYINTQVLLKTDQSDDQYLTNECQGYKKSTLWNYIKIKQQIKIARQSDQSSANCSPLLIKQQQETPGDLILLRSILPEVKGTKDSPEQRQNILERVNSTTLPPKSVSPQKVNGQSIQKQIRVLLKPIPANFDLYKDTQTVDLQRVKQYHSRQRDNSEHGYSKMDSSSPFHTKTTSFHQKTKYKTEIRPRQKRIQSTIDPRKNINDNQVQKYFQRKQF